MNTGFLLSSFEKLSLNWGEKKKSFYGFLKMHQTKHSGIPVVFFPHLNPNMLSAHSHEHLLSGRRGTSHWKKSIAQSPSSGR